MEILEKARADAARVVRVLRRGEFGRIRRGLRGRIDSERRLYGLYRDLEAPFDVPDPKVPLHIRPLRDEDAPLLLEEPSGETARSDPAHVQARLDLDAGFRDGYVAVTRNDQPCYVQWLIQPRDNGRMPEIKDGPFAELPPDTVMLHGAYTPPRFRRLPIMPAAMAIIAGQGRKLGFRWVVTWVGDDNRSMLRGCRLLGFQPYALHTTRWRKFRRNDELTPLQGEWEGGHPVTPDGELVGDRS